MNDRPLGLNKSFLAKSVTLILGTTFALAVLAGEFEPGEFPGPPESVNDYNETILQLALGDEINFPNRVFRMHYSTMSPGGMIQEHSHNNRPTVEYALSGTATETKKGRDGKIIVKKVHKDEVEISTVDLSHWWKNESKQMAKLMAVDIFTGDVSSICRPQGKPRTSPLVPPAKPDNVKIEELSSLDLSDQLPDVPEAKNYLFRSRRLTLLPKQKTQLEDGTGHPSITYIVQGDVWENRSDEASSIRRTGEYSVASKGITFYWENTTIDPVVLWVIDIVRKTDK